jgi:tRNA/tmRNA/rRNA uracil-C5-methylase (TrmA/RlmC/RlmD family)
MKTKKNREEASKLRQTIATDLRVWKEKIRVLKWQHCMFPNLKLDEQIAFCEEQVHTCLDDLQKLENKQRAWASAHGGI